MKFLAETRDTAEITKRQKTTDGYLEVVGVVTRAGVFEYERHEFNDEKAEFAFAGEPRLLMLRDENIVCGPSFKKSLALAPVTYNHPAQEVDIWNHKELAIGTIGEKVKVLDNAKIAVNIRITDPTAIAEIENGANELSLGSRVKFVRETGRKFGREYNCRAVDMEANHLAVLPKGTRGRAGPDVRILDSETEKEDDEMTRTEVAAMIKDSLPDFDDMQKKIVASLGDSLNKSLDEKFKNMEKKAEETAKLKDKEVQDAKEKSAEIKRLSDRRAEIIELTRPLIKPDEFAKLRDGENKPMLIAALGDSVQDAESKSEDFLLGAVIQIAKDRQDADRGLSRIQDSTAPRGRGRTLSGSPLSIGRLLALDKKTGEG